jgi:D-sedoheptulose 7-phosphate isomerase
VFAEQLKNFAEPGDIIMAVNSSGNSPNGLRALEFANSAGSAPSHPPGVAAGGSVLWLSLKSG